MATYATLTVTVRDIIGADFHESRASVWIEPNTPDGLILADGIRVGGRREQLVGGTATFANLVTTNSADNPTSFGYRVTISAPPKGASKREDMIVLTTSDFPLTATASLVDIPEAWDNITIPPVWRSDFLAQTEALRDETAAHRAAVEAVIINDLGTTDGQSKTLIETDGTLTKDALLALLARKSLIPASVFRAWGHSIANESGPGVTRGVNGMSTLTAAALGLPSDRRAVNGTTLAVHNSGTASWAGIMQAETRGQKFAPPGGEYGLMYGLNDLVQLGDTTAEMLPFRYALRAAIARLRAGAVFEDNDTTVTLGGSGTWTRFAATTYNSGSGISANPTNGGAITIALPASFPGGTISHRFVAYHDGSSGVISSTIDGAAGPSLDYRDLGTAVAAAGVPFRAPATLRMTGLKSGAQTVVLTTSSVTGAQGVMYDGWSWEPTESLCPPVAVIGQPKPIDYSSQGVNATNDAGIDVLNAIQQAVVAEFGDRVVYVDTTGIDSDPAYWSMGDVHPNVAGHAYIADQTAAALTALGTIVPADLSSDPADVGGTSTAWTNYTPALTGVTLGSGTLAASYRTTADNVIDFYFRITLAADSAITGAITVALPAQMANAYSIISLDAMFTDAGTNQYAARALALSTTAITLASPGTNGVKVNTSATSPFTWTTGDIIDGRGRYRRN